MSAKFRFDLINASYHLWFDCACAAQTDSLYDEISVINGLFSIKNDATYHI